MLFIPLLLLKLQAWMDHGESSKAYMRAKMPVDVADITQLLNLFVTKEALREDDVDWLPKSFSRAGKDRIREFVKSHPYTRDEWSMVRRVMRRVRADQ